VNIIHGCPNAAMKFSVNPSASIDTKVASVICAPASSYATIAVPGGLMEDTAFIPSVASYIAKDCPTVALPIPMTAFVVSR
jgi:hypothetical protein